MFQLLSNRVAIVTGGARGIGKSIALKFAEEGCSVVIGDILIEKGKETVDEIMKIDRNALFVQCDVTNANQVYNMVDQAVNKFGKIDILVNNAGGVGSVHTSETESEEDWNKLLDLNLKSVFLCCRAVVPHMKARRYGKIINISSMTCISPPVARDSGFAPAYTAAKAGVLGLTSYLAALLASYNINVNAILPAVIRGTGIFGERFSDEDWVQISKKIVPLQRPGTPEDIANAALFLASDLSSFITGALIPVSGGIPLPVPT